MSAIDAYISYAVNVVQVLVADIDFQEPTLQLSLICIAFNPIFWNIVARLEYRKKILTKLAGNNPKRGCYLLAITIFSIGIVRDLVYENALKKQPTSKILTDNTILKDYLSYATFGFGGILTLSSMYALGVTGTYLGDYFGILMEERVTSFPFNITDNPMYEGSTLSFLGTALYYGKPAGLFATGFVYLMYSIALKFEEPFTAMIYAKRDEERSKKQN
ncbi:bifunctional phosphatidyl-N-methylethanolamine N-methyltransferase/phosphatidyl-N-dimethylethanolamine N-methyltransferase [Ascoidea rubescens DSM 1968]|uniref:Phosphatidyl-N-methylethanolamine N-methyltransferase n=1 Tax=Ascoidea rubescens DSM 1968 TaxID=1344418 RepID=A0A1D2VQT4_9ASCO|nr:phospholipid methyltransferase [Ascoidea rubescens DSM 1968]ODV63959.1 phospholipid methyltransferase [Ascoidea rubescens DSM 1968]